MDLKVVYLVFLLLCGELWSKGILSVLGKTNPESI